MADIDEELMKLPPKERIEKLKELEKKRKKELADLEKKKEDEVKKAEELINESIEELTKQEEARFLREEALMHEEERRPIELEEAVAKEKPPEIKPTDNVLYNPFEQLEQGNVSIYNIANQDIYSKLKNMTEKIVHGEWTEADALLVDRVREQISTLQETRDEDYFNEKDPNFYLQRTEAIIKSLDIYRRMKNL